MDNNVLSSSHGLKQIERIAMLRVSTDFNQGLDARLVTREIARLISKIKWKRYIRFACDTSAQIYDIAQAISLLKCFGISPSNIFIYCLVRGIDEAHKRVLEIKKMGAKPFAQPYRSLDGLIIPNAEQKQFARWCNQMAVFNSCEWKDYAGSYTHNKHGEQTKQ
jgi:hypothetical protein